jgi:peptide/nickel transport system permease protein
MLLFVARRLVVSALLVLGLLSLVFVVLHAVPGDPLTRYMTPDMDPESIEQLRQRFGLDRPLPVQYWSYMRAFLVQGDFGTSLASRRPVADLLRETIPNTALLAGLALVLRFALGVAAGAAAAVRRNRPLDRVLMVGSLIVASMPAFWVGLMVVLVFALHLGWLPPGSMHAIDHAELAPLARLGDSLRHLAMPVFVLGIGGVASTARYMRASLLDELAQDYVRTARAKGLGARGVVLRHALRNALAPIVTLLGLSLPGIVGGALVVETVFAWPGMGRLASMAIAARDYPVVLGATFLSAVLVVIGNLLADVAGSLLDPRLRAH